MKKIILPILFFCLPLIAAEESTRALFNAAYREYQETLNSPKSLQHSQAARQAYQLGQELFPQSENLAVLAVNFAGVVEPAYYKEAEAALENALGIYQGLYGKDSLETLDVVFAQGKLALASMQTTKAHRYFRTATKIAEEHLDDPLLFANINLEIGEELLRVYSADGIKYMETADELYQTLQSPIGVEGQVRAKLRLGNYYLAKKQNARGVNSLNSALELGQANNTNPVILQSIHALLVTYYQDKKMMDEATTHSRAIGRHISQSGNKEALYLPLVVSQPVYPASALQKNEEGWVQVKFTVDEMGTPINPVVEDSQGSNLFHKAALDAIKNFRFAPAFKEDQPVATEGVQYVFRFNIFE